MLGNICFCVCIFILISLLFGANNDIKNYNARNNIYVYPVNISKQYNKEMLNDITQIEVNKIVDNTVYSITRSVLYRAKKGYTKYTWKDDENVLNNNIYEQVIDKIIIIFPDVKMEEFNGYTITFDWT